MTQPDPRPELRATLAGFDERQKKIIGGLFAVMIENADCVRDRDWIAEQYAQVVMLSSDLEDVESVDEGVQQVQKYMRENIDTLLGACFRLFQVVGEDLAPRVKDGISREQALAHALDYFGDPPQ